MVMTSSRGLSRLFFTRAWHSNVAQARRHEPRAPMYTKEQIVVHPCKQGFEKKGTTQIDAENMKNSGDETDRATVRSTTHTPNSVCVQTKRGRHNCWILDKGTKDTRKHGRHKEYKQFQNTHLVHSRRTWPWIVHTIRDKNFEILGQVRMLKRRSCRTQKGEKQHPHWQNVETVQTHYKIRKLSHFPWTILIIHPIHNSEQHSLSACFETDSSWNQTMIHYWPQFFSVSGKTIW